MNKSVRLSRGGLSYLELGTGPKNLVFLHGIGGDSNHFLGQAEYFARKHRVLVPDFFDHGKSGATDSPSTLDDLERDLAEWIDSLKLSDYVLIGHSMGALVAMKHAAKEYSGLRGIAMMDPPVLLPKEVLDALGPIYHELLNGNFESGLKAFAENVFFISTDDPQRKIKIIENLFKLPKERFLSLWGSMGTYPVESDAPKITVPTLCLIGNVPCDLDRLKTLCPQVQIGRAVGTGHYLHLEVPEQVNSMIDAFLSKSVRF